MSDLGQTETQGATATETRTQKAFKVVLFNDEDHTYD